MRQARGLTASAAGPLGFGNFYLFEQHRSRGWHVREQAGEAPPTATPSVSRAIAVQTISMSLCAILWAFQEAARDVGAIDRTKWNRSRASVSVVPRLPSRMCESLSSFEEGGLVIVRRLVSRANPSRGSQDDGRRRHVEHSETRSAFRMR